MQGDRGILEFKYQYPGMYMFHSHKTEFTMKGWMGMFDVTSPKEIGSMIKIPNTPTAKTTTIATPPHIPTLTTTTGFGGM